MTPSGTERAITENDAFALMRAIGGLQNAMLVMARSVRDDDKEAVLAGLRMSQEAILKLLNDIEKRAA